MMAPNPSNPRRLPAENLPPFDPDAACPKCGHDRVSARYRVWTGAFTQKQREWICRQCERCGFLWDEACLPGSTVDRSWSEDDDPDWSDD